MQKRFHHHLTSFSSHFIVFVKQEVFWRLGAEGEGGQLEDGRDGGDGQQPGPSVLSAEYVVHAQNLGQEDGEGDGMDGEEEEEEKEEEVRDEDYTR